MPDLRRPLLLLALGTAACASPELTEAPPDLLVARGAPIWVEVLSEQEIEQNLAGWSEGEIEAWAETLAPMDVYSADPGVFDVLDGDGEWATSVPGAGVSDGAATIHLDDPWGEPREVSIAVQTPDHVALQPYAPAWAATSSPGALARAGAPKVLVGSAVELEVALSRDGQTLQGAHLLEVEHGEGLESAVRVEGGRDVLRVAPLVAGPHLIELFIGGEPAGVASIEAVTEQAIAGIELVPLGELYPAEGELVQQAIRAEGFDGEPIYGASLDWTIDGIAAEPGDSVVYPFAGDAALPIAARLGDLVVEVSLPATEAEIYTAEAGGGALDPVSGLLALGLGALCLGAGRERRG